MVQFTSSVTSALLTMADWLLVNKIFSFLQVGQANSQLSERANTASRQTSQQQETPLRIQLLKKKFASDSGL